MSEEPALIRTIALNIRCFNLPNLDTLSLTDPVCIVKSLQGSGEWRQIGITELIDDDLDPIFNTPIRLLYRMEEQQQLQFDLWDIDSSDFAVRQTISGGDDHIGTATCYLSEIVGSPNSTLKLQIDLDSRLSRRKRKMISFVEISVDEIESSGISNEIIELRLRGSRLKKMDVFGKSDPYFRLMKKMSDGTFRARHKSEILKVTLEPKWKPCSIHLSQFVHSSKDEICRIEVWDWDKGPVAGHDLIGVIDCSPNQLVTGAEFELRLPGVGMGMVGSPSASSTSSASSSRRGKKRRRKKDLRGFLHVDFAAARAASPIGLRKLHSITDSQEETARSASGGGGGVKKLIRPNGSFVEVFDEQLGCDMRILTQGEQHVPCHILFMARAPVLRRAIDQKLGEKVFDFHQFDIGVVRSVIRWLYGEAFSYDRPDDMNCIHATATLAQFWGIYEAIRPDFVKSLRNLQAEDLVKLLCLSFTDQNKQFHSMVLEATKGKIAEVIGTMELCQMLVERSHALYVYVSRLQFRSVTQVLEDSEIRMTLAGSLDDEEEGETEPREAVLSLREHLLLALEQSLYADMSLCGTVIEKGDVGSSVAVVASGRGPSIRMHRVVLVAWLGPTFNTISKDENVLIPLQSQDNMNRLANFFYRNEIDRGGLPATAILCLELAGVATEFHLDTFRDACVSRVVELLTDQAGVIRLLLKFGPIAMKIPAVVAKCKKFVSADGMDILVQFGQTKVIPDD